MPPKKAAVAVKKGKAKKIVEDEEQHNEDEVVPEPEAKLTAKVKGAKRGASKKTEADVAEGGDSVPETKPASARSQRHVTDEEGDTKPAAKGRAAKRPAKKEDSPQPTEEEEVKPKKVRGRKGESSDAADEEVAAANKEASPEHSNGVEVKPKRGRAKKEEVAEVVKPAAVKGKKRGAANTPAAEEEAEVKPAKGRAAKRSAKKEETPEPSTIEQEVKPKRSRAKKTPSMELSEEEHDAKPKKGGRAKKTPSSELSEEEQDAKPKKGGRAKKEPAKEKALLNNATTDYAGMDFNCTKANADGKTPNFKISSWNVDGLRACLKKDGLMYIEREDPDVFCLQETKCNETTIPQEITNIEGYKQYWAYANKAGYSGVGLFSKVEPIEVTYGIGSEYDDEEGRCITAEFERFYVVSVYVPNSGRKLVTMPKRMEWNEAFKAHITKLDETKPVIVCGDLNVAHEAIDLANPKTNTKNAGFTQEERDGMTDFLGSGFVDTFRNFNPEGTGCYTFWTYMGKSRTKNVGWRLDYFLVSERFMNTVCDSIIRSEIFGSDHCPITLFLNI